MATVIDEVDARIQALDGFWTRQFAFYLNEHRNPSNRVTHYIGIPVLIGTALWGLIMLDWKMFIGGQLLGWAFQLAGHKVEGNKPALLKNPTAWLMGPLMVLVEMLEKVGVRFGFADQARASIEIEL